MAMEVVWTPHGRAAAEALRDAVGRAKGAEPLAPVTVVVPSNHVGVASRRLLASGAVGPVTTGAGVGLVAVTFVTPYRLGELLGAGDLAATGRRPVSTPVLAAAVRTELAARPGLFEPVAQHPATESALVATYRELRDCSPTALDALAGTSARAAEVVRLHRAVRARLEPRWSDEEDLLRAAAARAGSPAAAALGAIVVHLPQRLSRHAAELLRALGEHQPVTVVAGTTGFTAADAEVFRSLERLGLSDPPPSTAPPSMPVAPDRTTVLTTSDADEEVRSAVRAVVRAVHHGTRLDRIAVLHATPEPYARLAHEQLHAAGIATNGAAVVPLAGRVAGRTLLELLTLPDGRFRRQDVMAWLASGPVLHEGRWAPVAAWERISREAAVVAGREQWAERLEGFAAQEEERAAEAEADDERPVWMAERAREQADRARALRRFVLHVIDDLAEAARAPRAWSQHAAWAQRWLLDLLGPASRRTRWPEAEHKAAERVELALHRLAALDDVEGPVPLQVFARTLSVELEADLGRVGRFGEGVLVGSVEMGVGLDLDLLVVLGLAEGSFPASVRDDSLLPDRERLATGDELELRSARVERQHRHLLGSLAGAARQLLCVPRGDLRRSAERVPSRWVLDIATTLAGSAAPWWGEDLLEARAPWVHHVPSFDAGLRHAPDPATPQEHRLVSLLATGGRLEEADDERTRAGAEVVRARRSAAFTRFDGNVGDAGLAIPSPAGSLTSPTRLERWAGCPLSYLVEDLLRASPVENPEDELEISALERGSLVHQILEDFIREVLERPAGEQPGPMQPWTAADHQRIEALGRARCEEWEARGLTGRPIFWRRDRRRILADLHEFLDRDSVHRGGRRTVPVAAELGFGFDGEGPPVELPLPDGRVLRFRGRADRLDEATDGTLHVIDYKTGGSRGYTGLSEEHPVLAGTRLQLPVYGLAARAHRGNAHTPVHAEYWFVTTKGEFRHVGYQVTEEVLERARGALAAIVTGIEAGRFPAHPDASATNVFVSCRTCDPDGLGTVDLRRQWERKRSDPLLAPYAQLVEPLDDEEVPA